MIIKMMYLGNDDHLYKKRPEAGCKLYYCVMHKSDYAHEMPAQGVYLANTLKEAESELAEY